MIETILRRDQRRRAATDDRRGSKRHSLETLLIQRRGDEKPMARPALRRANVIEETWIHVDRRSYAGARHWSEHGDLQRRQRGATAAAAVRRTGEFGCALGE